MIFQVFVAKGSARYLTYFPTDHLESFIVYESLARHQSLQIENDMPTLIKITLEDTFAGVLQKKKFLRALFSCCIFDQAAKA